MVKSVVATNQFKRDIKKHALYLITPQWVEVMNCLIFGGVMPARYANHPLKGEWKGCMDCHVRPDLVLIYEFDDDTLLLHRLGAHSELSIA